MKKKELNHKANDMLTSFTYSDIFVVENEKAMLTENAFMCLIYLAINRGKEALGLYRNLKKYYRNREGLFSHTTEGSKTSIPGSLTMGLAAIALGHENFAREITYHLKRFGFLENYLFNVSMLGLIRYGLDKNSKPYYLLEKLKQFKNPSELYRNYIYSETEKPYSNAVSAVLLNLLEKQEEAEQIYLNLSKHIHKADLRDKTAFVFMCLALAKKNFGNLCF